MFCAVIVDIIVKYIPNFEFLDWISKKDEINWSSLSKNPNAIELLQQNQDKIDWCILSENPNSIHLLERNLDKINWSLLSLNVNAVQLLRKNSEKNCMELFINKFKCT